jgi:hypothetical protein
MLFLPDKKGKNFSVPTTIDFNLYICSRILKTSEDEFARRLMETYSSGRD